MSLKPRKSKGGETPTQRYKRKQAVLRTIGKDDFSKLNYASLERRWQQVSSRRQRAMRAGEKPDFFNAQLDLIEIEMGKRRGEKNPKPATIRKQEQIIFFLDKHGEYRKLLQLKHKVENEIDFLDLDVNGVGIHDSYDGRSKTVSVTVSGSQTDDEALQTEGYVYNQVESMFGRPSAVGHPTIVDVGWQYTYEYRK